MNKRKDIEVKVGDETVKVYVQVPSSHIIQRADRYKAKVWTECIEDGIKTKDELKIIMKKRGIWNSSHSEKEAELVEEIQELEKSLYLGKGSKKSSLEEGKKIAIKMRQLRNSLRELIMEKMNMESNTAEALADNARFDFLVACCTYHENGDNVYNGIDDYNDKSADEIAFAAASALASLMYNYTSDTEKSLPENKWLMHFNLVNEDLSLVNDKKELIDLDGRKINDQGHYINDKGQRIDIEGNLLDKDGNYVIQVDYDSKPARKTRKTVKQPADS
jgi:hypothetical protein